MRRSSTHKLHVGLAGVALAMLLALPQGATAARIAVEASGGGMTVNGSARADQIEVGYDPSRPSLVVVRDPKPPYTRLSAGGTCESGTHPSQGTPEVRCTLSEPVRRGARIVVAPHFGRDKVWIGVVVGGRIDPSAPFPYKAAEIGSPGADRVLVAGEGSKLGGGPGDDTLLGGSGASTLTGAAGDDRLIDRWGGDDILHGGKGDDLLEGWAGQDLLTGWKGRDALLGGAGGDRLYSRDGWRDRRIDCGASGADEARVERSDPASLGCEEVRRIGRDLAVGEEIDFP